MNGSNHDFSRFGAPERGRERADARHCSTERGLFQRVGVIYNARSHRNKGRDLNFSSRAGIMVAQPRRREELHEALAQFAQAGVDYLVINGGDGTVRDVLTCGQPLFGDDWPEVAVLPKGKTNALNVDLGAPADWSLAAALEAFDRGRRVVRRPLAISPAGQEEDPVQGFILGAGAFTAGIEAGQDAHRMGAFNSLAVAVATGWGVVQTVFGGRRNRWRRGVGVRLVLHSRGTARELPHSGHGDRARRGVIFASTLEGFPVGVRPFAREKGPIRIAVLDTMRRRLMALLPVMLAGYDARWLSRAGVHRASAEAIDMTLEGRFILDGEAFPAGDYSVRLGPEIRFVVP